MHTFTPFRLPQNTATGSCSSGRWDDQDEWGAQRGESELQLMPNLMSRITGKEKMQVAYGILSGWHGVKNIYSNGDKAYCEAIKSAAHKAKFRPSTIRKSTEIFRNLALTCGLALQLLYLIHSKLTDLMMFIYETCDVKSELIQINIISENTFY